MTKPIVRILFILAIPVCLVILAAIVISSQQEQKQMAAHTQSSFAPSGVWSDIATFPSMVVTPTPGTQPLRIKRAAAAAYPPNGNVYLFGGRHGLDGEDVALSQIWQYTPGANTWTQKTAQVYPGSQGSVYGSNMAAAVLTDANGIRIYLVGSSTINDDVTGTVNIYNPIADSISALTTDPWPPSPARVPGGYAVYNNKLYVFGGFSALANGSAGGVFTDTWKFDPMATSGSRWTQLATANLNLGRGFIAGATLDGYIYAIGGDTWTPGSPGSLNPVTNVERMDPSQANPTWQNVAFLPTARGDMGAWAYDTGTGYEISGEVAVDGGHYTTPDAQGYIYTPGTNTWATFPNLVHATRNYGTAQLNGTLYALGGYDYSSNTPTGANFNQAYNAILQGTPTPTHTGTPATATPTRTSTNTPTATPTICGATSNYNVTTSAGATIVAGTTFVTGSNCDDCSSAIALPFPFRLYDQTFTSVNAISNGNLQFVSTVTDFTNACLPYGTFNYAILPHWDDLLLTGTNQGIYTSISGTAPNRIFNIEWIGGYFSGGGSVDFEVRLYETSPTARFDIVYGTVTQGGSSATIGVQRDTGSLFTQWECNTGGVTTGLMLTFQQPPCGTSTPTNTPIAATATRTNTVLPTNTPMPPSNTPVPPSSTPVPPSNTPVPPTNTPAPTNTPVPSNTPLPTNTPVPSNTPQPTQTPGSASATPVPTNTNTSVPSNTAVNTSTNTPPPANTPTSPPTSTDTPVPPSATTTSCALLFTDVGPDNPFYSYIRCLACRNIVNGYHTAVSCISGTPCFKPAAPTTRGELAKFVSNAAGYSDNIPPTQQTFTDVAPSTTFWLYIERVAAHGVISGYLTSPPCTTGTPCFLPGANVTRGQTAKFVSNAAGYSDNIPPTQQTFTDVPNSDPFWLYIERDYMHGVINGYTTSPPCTTGTPCFMTFNPVTRGQTAKFIANAFYPDCQTPRR